MECYSFGTWATWPETACRPQEEEREKEAKENQQLTWKEQLALEEQMKMADKQPDEEPQWASSPAMQATSYSGNWGNSNGKGAYWPRAYQVQKKHTAKPMMQATQNSWQKTAFAAVTGASDHIVPDTQLSGYEVEESKISKSG